MAPILVIKIVSSPVSTAFASPRSTASNASTISFGPRSRNGCSCMPSDCAVVSIARSSGTIAGVSGLRSTATCVMPDTISFSRLDSFGPQLRIEKALSGDVSSRACEAGNDPGRNGVADDRHHDRYRRGGLLRGKRPWCCMGHDQVDFGPNEFERQFGQSPIVSIRPSIVDEDVRALDVAAVTQTLPKSIDPAYETKRGCGSQKPDARDLAGLLRARRERPCGHRAAEQSDELAAAAHSITSSARASSVGGISMPRAFAVLRL